MNFFSVEPDGRYKFYVDNHRLSTFTTCPQLFDYTQLRCLRTKRKGSALVIGGWWSRTLELFYREMSFGSLPTIDQLFKFGADAWSELGNDVKDIKQANKEWGWNDALLMMTHYYWAMASNDFKNWKIVGTEVGFGLKNECLIGETKDIIVYYTGKPDLIIFDIGRGKFMIGDHKTVDYIKGDTLIKYKPHPQTAGYVFAAQKLAKDLGFDSNAVTDVCFINITSRNPPAEKPRDGIKKPRCIRAYPNYNPEELEEWRLGVLRKCSQIKHSISTGEWSRHENSCHIYGGCGFRGVCSVPPPMRDTMLKADFVQVDPWTPYDVEEEGA